MTTQFIQTDEEKPLEGTVFFTLRLSVNPAGEILGDAKYTFDTVEQADPELAKQVRKLCYYTGKAMAEVAPRVIDAAEEAVGLVNALHTMITEAMETKESDDSSSKDTKGVALSGELKQHGTVVH